MRFAAHLAAPVFLNVALTSAASAAVLDIAPTPLVIRIYDASPLPTVDQTTLDEARSILTAAGVEPEWLPCGLRPAEGTRCAVPLAASELAVRVVLAPPPPGPAGRTQLALGYSLVDADSRSGSLATVYLDRVQWLAHASSASVTTLLARAIVHEIGHLLLGIEPHSRSGVMRAIWTRETIHRSRAADWRFSGREARRMREAIALRGAKEKVARRE